MCPYLALSSVAQSHHKATSYIHFCRTNYHRWTALYEHHLPIGRDLPEWYKPKMTRFFTLVEEALIPYAGRNRKRARRAAKILWASIHGLCVLSFSGKLDVVGAESIDVLAKDLVTSLLTGLTK